MIEAEGRAVTPGFIDIHRHGDMAAFRDNFGQLELSQGLTTVINGNCGMSAAPVDKGDQRFAQLPAPGDRGYTPICKHRHDGRVFQVARQHSAAFELRNAGGMRRGVVPLCSAESTRPKLRQGNFAKYSSGSLHREPWAYPWAWATRRSASLPPMSLSAALNRCEIPIYPSPSICVRKAAGACDAIREVIKIGETLHAHVHVSHLKAMGKRNWNSRIPEGLELIRSARERGLNMTCDVYPYTGG